MKSSSETTFDFHRDMYGLGCGEDAEKSFEEQRVAERSVQSQSYVVSLATSRLSGQQYGVDDKDSPLSLRQQLLKSPNSPNRIWKIRLWLVT
jgi:hypothetical protein